MTPKTQYQKMRDNRARRESMLASAREWTPVVGSGNLEMSSVVLEDGSVLAASGPLQNDPHHELRKTWAPGQWWQRREPGRDWVDTVKPSWLENVQYRRHPNDIDQEKPWYPDSSGEWVEVPDDCMECPIEPLTKVFVLLRCDRIKKERYGRSYAAGDWCWDVDPRMSGRIIAFKVAA